MASSNLRVSFDTEIFGLQAHGGISRYFAALLRHLRDYDVDARVVAPLTFNQHLVTGMPGFVGVRLPLAWRNRYSVKAVQNAQALLDLASSALLPCDVLHRTMYARLLASRAPVVVTAHDMIPELFPHYFSGGTPHPGKARALREASSVLAVSETTKADVIRLLGVPAERILVTPLGVEPAFSRVSDVDDGTILFVGTRRGYKDFGTFARAAARVLQRRPQLRVVCVGGGPFEISELDPFTSAGVATRVVHTSPDDEGLVRLFGRARVFVFPSLYEGFGLPILEAFAAGCPALVARASCFPEVAGDAAAYFRPGDEDDLVEQLSRLDRDDAYRCTLRTRGALRVRDYTWDRTARLTAAAYRRAVSTPLH